MSFYKYGLPDGMTDEEKEALKQRIADMQADFDRMIRDPEFLEENRRNAKIAGMLRPCDLDMQFTI